jgi:hypothetical protein
MSYCVDHDVVFSVLRHSPPTLILPGFVLVYILKFMKNVLIEYISLHLLVHNIK